MAVTQPKSAMLPLLRSVGSPKAKGYIWALLLKQVKESLGREGWQRQGSRKSSQAGEQPVSQAPRSKMHVRKQV